MNKDRQLDWEARTGRIAAAAALASLVLFLASGIYVPLALDERPDGAHEVLRAADREPTDFVVAGVLQGLAVALLSVVLWYLYRATRHRRPELPQVALVLLLLGPLLLAVVDVARQLQLLDVADDFLARDPGGRGAEERAEDLIQDRGTTVAAVGFAAGLMVGLAMVLVNLNAMRAGLLSRILGILGIVIGALYVLPLTGGPQILQLFWLGALGMLFLGRWPGGRGPAWQTGQAIPWPSAAEQRAEIERRRAEREGGAAESAAASSGEEPEAAEGEAEPAAPSRRKRKRRR